MVPNQSEPDSVTLKMEAVHCPETSYYAATKQCTNPKEGYHLHSVICVFTVPYHQC